MNNNVIQNNQKNQQANPDDVLKATALLYLQDALVSEQYEDAPELIATAKKFGAQQGEISKVIAEYVAGVRKGRRNEANQRQRGRRT